MKISALRSRGNPDHRTVTVENPGDGDDLRIVYDEKRITPSLIRRFHTIAESEAKGQVDGVGSTYAAVELLMRIVVEWNLEDEEGRTVGLNEQELEQLGMDLIQTLVELVFQHRSSNTAGKAPSGGSGNE